MKVLVFFIDGGGYIVNLYTLILVLENKDFILQLCYNI